MCGDGALVGAVMDDFHCTFFGCNLHMSPILPRIDAMSCVRVCGTNMKTTSRVWKSNVENDFFLCSPTSTLSEDGSSRDGRDVLAEPVGAGL